MTAEPPKTGSKGFRPPRGVGYGSANGAAELAMQKKP